MGVQGLWTLISPVARPINLETMGNKRLAIDSSIWLYQFQKAMRDREGRGIANAHILGFLRRISKLLYYGIKPVFVFDGGVPTLKKQTINERKKRKRGGQENLAKTAEKLLAAQLRQAAVSKAQKRSKGIDTGDLITDNTVYFDDSTAQDFSEKNASRRKTRFDASNATPTPVQSPEKRSRFVPKDQYQLPPIEQVPSFTEKQTDHRLATELELKQFIHEFTPDDLDINSPHFQSLSTELKYEIIGDLRIKSRQPNKTRVEAMRKTSDHEFSQTQILNLKKRNDLTQKLLTVTDMVAKANLTIPVKIAAQRNKEYVLVKASEGWILGIENEKESGSAKKPLRIDVDSENDDVPSQQENINEPGPLKQRSNDLPDSDDEIELEEVIAPTPSTKMTQEQRDADLTDAIRFHYGTKDQETVAGFDETLQDKPMEDQGLFQPLDENEEIMRDIIGEVAAHEHLNHSNQGQSSSSHDFVEGSKKTMSKKVAPDEGEKQGSSSSAQFISNTEPQRTTVGQTMINNLLESIDLEVDDEFQFSRSTPPPVDIATVSKPALSQDPAFNSDPLIPESLKLSNPNDHVHQAALASNETSILRDDKLSQAPTVELNPPLDRPESEFVIDDKTNETISTTDLHGYQIKADIPLVLGNKDAQKKEVLAEDMGKVSQVLGKSLDQRSTCSPLPTSPKPIPAEPSTPSTLQKESASLLQRSTVAIHSIESNTEPASVVHQSTSNSTSDIIDHSLLKSRNSIVPNETVLCDFVDGRPRHEFPTVNVTGSPETTAEISIEEQPQALGSDDEELDKAVEAEERELDENLALESNQWNEFLSGLEDQEKLEEMRQEAESEVRRLKEQRAKDRRDADDVNLQISQDVQNLLKLFGIPYVVSPMEAEAQCSELLKLKLVDGIITDDSDVFLFGGHKVYKNLFNQNKFVECYLMNDLEQELGLNQEKLIQLAFLLGSDYTTGLNGVGPVTAMEILSEFDLDNSPGTSNHDNQHPNLNALLNFKNWWRKVQVGKDTELDSGTSFRNKFRKKKDKIWIDDSWPNPIVAEAYLHPTVDHSSEKFVWGLPDLDGIREFLYDHLTWSSTKTDEVIVPLIKRQMQRSNGTIQTQGILDDFFDYSVDNNTSRLAPPGINSAFSSQRLQKIVKNWREKKKIINQGAEDQPESESFTTTSRSTKSPVKRAKPVRRPRQARKMKETEPGPGGSSNEVVAPTRTNRQQVQVSSNKSNNGKRKSTEPNVKKTKTSGKRPRQSDAESTTSLSSVPGEASDLELSNWSVSDDDQETHDEIHSSKKKKKKI